MDTNKNLSPRPSVLCKSRSAFLTAFGVVLLFTGCASMAPKLTKWHAVEMRIAVIGDNIADESVNEVQSYLIESNRYHVVDRGRAMKAIIAEQEMTNVTNADRFEDSEKFAQMGKLLGVGGIIKIGANCRWKYGHWGGQWQECVTSLTLYSASTGIAISSSSMSHKLEEIDWRALVIQFNDNLPSHELETRWSADMLAKREQIKKDAEKRRTPATKEDEK